MGIPMFTEIDEVSLEVDNSTSLKQNLHKTIKNWIDNSENNDLESSNPYMLYIKITILVISVMGVLASLSTLNIVLAAIYVQNGMLTLMNDEKKVFKAVALFQSIVVSFICTIEIIKGIMTI